MPDTAPAPKPRDPGGKPDERRARSGAAGGGEGKAALVAWAIALVAVAILVHVNVQVRFIGHVGSALVAVLFLYTPVIVGARRGEDLDVYGFRVQRPLRDLAYAGGAMLVIFPLFVLGYHAFYDFACRSHWFVHVAPRGMCGPRTPPPLGWDFAEFCIEQLVVVALPEELFFRGMLLSLLERKYPPARRFLGGGLGRATVLAAAAFAIIHLPKDGDPRALATFFPGLLFCWMRSATGSIFASSVTHGCSNILVRLLDLGLL